MQPSGAQNALIETMDDHRAPVDSNDAALVALFLRGGDESAFRQLFRRHGPAMYALATRILGDPGREAEDAVQEAWVRAAKGLASFGWRSSLRTWLTGITVNCCREVLRSRLRDRHESIESDPGANAGPRDSAARLDLEHAIRILPAGYRAVFVLHDIEGWTHAEIGARLGIEAGTSKSQLAHARQALRAHWRASPAKEDSHAR